MIPTFRWDAEKEKQLISLFFFVPLEVREACAYKAQTEGFNITKQQYYAIGCFSSDASTTHTVVEGTSCSLVASVFNLLFYHLHNILYLFIVSSNSTATAYVF